MYVTDLKPVDMKCKSQKYSTAFFLGTENTARPCKEFCATERQDETRKTNRLKAMLGDTRVEMAETSILFY